MWYTESHFTLSIIMLCCKSHILLSVAFPSPDLRCIEAYAPANPRASAGGSAEAMIDSMLP